MKDCVVQNFAVNELLGCSGLVREAQNILKRKDIDNKMKFTAYMRELIYTMKDDALHWKEPKDKKSKDEEDEDEDNVPGGASDEGDGTWADQKRIQRKKAKVELDAVWNKYADLERVHGLQWIFPYSLEKPQLNQLWGIRNFLLHCDLLFRLSDADSYLTAVKKKLNQPGTVKSLESIICIDGVLDYLIYLDKTCRAKLLVSLFDGELEKVVM